MNENLNDIYQEKRINITEMFFYVLRKWKVILSVALAAALAAGALTYVKSAKNAKNSTGSSVSVKEQIFLSEEEKEDLEHRMGQIGEYEQIIAECDEYLEKSIRIKLDPMGYYIGTQQYIFSGGTPSEVLTAVLQCKGRLGEEATIEALAEELGGETENSYLREVISTSVGIERRQQTFTLENSGEILNISVMHYDREQCEAILAYFSSIMEEEAGLLKQSESPVTVEKTADAVAATTNRDAINASKEIYSMKFNAYDSLATAKENLSDAQRRYYEALKKEEAGEDQSSAVLPSPAAVDWKMTIAAAILAAFCTGAFYAAAYLFGGKIHTKREMESMVLLPVAGYCPSDHLKKNPVDKLLDRLETKAYGKTDDTAEMVCEMLRSYAGQKNVKKLYLSGSCMDNQQAERLKPLVLMLQKDGIELRIGQDLLTDAEALKEALEYKTVVFWEKCHRTRERDVKEEVSRVLSCGADVLAVVVEN